MNDHRHNNELLELLDALCDERLDAAELHRLESILRDDPSAQTIYFEYLDLHLELGHTARANVQPEPPPQRGLKSAWRRRRTVAALVSMLAAVMLFALYFIWPTDHSSHVSELTITSVSGTTLLQSSDGKSRAAEVGASLVAGERIITQGSGALAVVQYDDGTRLSLVNDASASYTPGERKVVSLHEGTASVQVSPQPANRPMLLATPNAEIEVVGTRFAVAAVENRTELHVASGRVRLTRKRDQQSVEVSQGESIVSDNNAALSVRAGGPAATWNADFEQGVPTRWTGSPVTIGLPADSLGAITAERDPDSTMPTHVISTPDEWVGGLFQVHADTHLHITFKMDRPDWLNIFFSTRSTDATTPGWTLHNFNEVPFWPPQPGKWRTITIPLSDFRRKIDGVFTNQSPIESEVVYSLSVTFTGEDRGLVIDRMWVTRGGSGKVETKLVK